METKTSRASNTKWWVLSGLFFLVFLGLCWIVKEGRTQDWDWSVSLWVFDHRSAGLSTLMETITYAGNTASIITVILLLLAFDKTRWRMGLPIFCTALLTNACKTVVKGIMERPRPDETYRLIAESGYSFPSGHAITSVAVYFLIGYLLWYYYKKEGDRAPMAGSPVRIVIMAASFFLAAAVGLSRVYVGVHFLTDVFGGWTFGLAAACLAVFIIRKTDWPGPIERRLGIMEANNEGPDMNQGGTL